MPQDSHPPIKVLIFSASLRAGSLNDRLASLAAQVVERDGAHVDRASMADFDCPSYDQDVESESGIPAPANDFCRRLRAADALMISAPEYNASMPGSLKNTIDWMSRERPQPFNGKQCFLLSASPSMVGGNRGLWALRIPLEHLGSRVYPDMFSLAQAHLALDGDGQIANEELRRRFQMTIASFMDLVEASKHYPCVKSAWVEYLGEHPEPAIDRVQ
jgi:chromate reductase, NAD(P)H dehydrogenase (quinone)